MIQNKKRIYLLIILLVFLVGGIIANSVAANWLLKKFRDEMPLAPDTFFTYFQFRDFSVLNETLVIVAFVLIISYVYHHKKYEDIPYYLLIFGIFQWLRASFIILTPLLPPHTPYGLEFGLAYKLFPSISHRLLPGFGMFPSGHVSISFFGMLIAWERKWYRFIFLGLFLLTVLTMLLSRGHYSIDIIGTIFIVYSIFVFTQRHLKERLRAWGKC